MQPPAAEPEAAERGEVAFATSVGAGDERLHRRAPAAAAVVDTVAVGGVEEHRRLPALAAIP